MRGGVKKFKYTFHDRQMIKSHINDFPRDESHYKRTESDKEYLSPDLNVNREYLANKIKELDITFSYKFYRSVFLKVFHKFPFKRPRVDTCKMCDALDLKRTIIEVASSGKIELELHHLRLMLSQKLSKVMV